MAQVFYDNQRPVYRNTAGSTSITLDSSNNQMIINNSVLGKTITINSEEFSNGVETLTYQKMYAKINAVEASIYPPINTTTCQFVDTLIVSDTANLGLATTSSTLTGGQLTIQDLNGAGTRSWTADAGSLNINDGTSLTSYIDAGSATFTATGSGQNTIINSFAITTTDAVSYTSSLDNANLTFNDTSTNISLQLTNDSTVSPTPFIKMTESSGLVNTFSWGELNADGNYCYTFNNNEKFFKQQNPFSFRQVELFDGDTIEKDYPFVFAQNVSTLKLRDPPDYLDDNGLAGWSVIVSNYSGSSINIDIASASSWYSHSNGGGQLNPIVLKKWATCRFTLVYSSIDNEYIWAVAEF
jgi:hypothetical protein